MAETIEYEGGTYTGDIVNPWFFKLFSDGVPHGKGTWTQPEGDDKYVGEYKNSLPDGRGTWT